MWLSCQVCVHVTWHAACLKFILLAAAQAVANIAQAGCARGCCTYKSRYVRSRGGDSLSESLVRGSSFELSVNAVAPVLPSQGLETAYRRSTYILPSTMPLYELLCLSKPLMARQELAALMRQCGELLCTGGGVITGIKSYGNQELAYNIRRPFEKYGEVSVGS